MTNRYSGSPAFRNALAIRSMCAGFLKLYHFRRNEIVLFRFAFIAIAI